MKSKNCDSNNLKNLKKTCSKRSNDLKIEENFHGKYAAELELTERLSIENVLLPISGRNESWFVFYRRDLPLLVNVNQ